MMLKNPCYDSKNHKDCENREAGCSLICALWHDYVKRRDEGYEQRKKIAEAERAFKEHHIRLKQRTEKHKRG